MNADSAWRAALLGGWLLAGMPAPAAGATVLVPDGFANEVIAGSLSTPVGMAFLPDGRLLVIEQRTARVLVLPGTAGAPPSVAGTIPGVQSAEWEAGLLGVAVDPGWPARPYLYFHYTADENPRHVHVARLTATGDLAGTGDGNLTLDLASRFDLITDAPDNAGNHNGGTLRFGLDGMLYASFGEDATPCAAQDTVSLRGVILRLDVSGLPAGPGTATRAQVTPADNPFVTASNPNTRLVWAFGLRNPFRFQVDPATGALDIADVGQNAWEELDYAGQGGLDFGWPFLEGPADYMSSCPGIVRPTLTPPVFSYSHAAIGMNGGLAIIAAGVYRDPGTPASAATAFPPIYVGLSSFVSDFYVGHLWHLRGSGATRSVAPPVPGQPHGDYWGEGFEVVSDYAIGPDGALWYCREASNLNFNLNTGEIGRIIHLNDSSSAPAHGPAAVLRPAFPLPAAGSVRLDFALSVDARVTLRIYDTRGRRVRELVRPETRPAGTYTDSWDGLDDEGRLVEAGLYFGDLQAGADHFSWRIVIAR